MFAKANDFMLLSHIKIKNMWSRFLHEEKGGAEIVAIILIIIVIIGLVALFKDQLTTLIGKWFEKITEKSGEL